MTLWAFLHEEESDLDVSGVPAERRVLVLCQQELIALGNFPAISRRKALFSALAFSLT